MIKKNEDATFLPSVHLHLTKLLLVGGLEPNLTNLQKKKVKVVEPQPTTSDSKLGPQREGKIKSPLKYSIPQLGEANGNTIFESVHCLPQFCVKFRILRMLLFSATRPLNPPQPLPFLSFSRFVSLSLPLPILPNPSRSTHFPSLQIYSIDAAQPFDYESHLKNRYLQSTSLKIAIIGFGNFGQFLSETFIRHHHTLLAHSRTNYTNLANQLGVSFFSDPNDLFEQHPDVVLLSTSILSTETLLQQLPFQRLRRNTLFVDVLSVKEFPRNLFLKYLPPDFDILCTHPMFGPESGKNTWAGLPFVYDKVRIGDEESRVKRCEKFLDIFEKEGCRMVEMSCMEHDKYAAGSQFVTHTMGRVLEQFGLESSPINTKGYETLLNLVENTKGDSFDLYYGLFMYNQNALEQLERLDMAFESIKKELFGRLHRVYRKQLFGDKEEKERERRFAQKLLGNGGLIDPPLDNVGQDGS
ncbi:Prephenate dehydrogenase family protein [Theobroma cacao]|uniref:Prephenate dehydrogenase family protein n=2 Tax=Theobroma cacao TaxID=3641 RepID=A0A061G8L4_THECC|nr:Prephenate dehydrogenase family protein [Theobroma cacao]